MNNLKIRLPAAIALLLVALLLAGCARHKVTPDYYTLKPVSEMNALSRDQSMGILPVTLPGWLDQGKMTWSDGGVNLVTRDHERWAGPLGKVINQTLLRNFNRLYPGSEISLGPWERSGWPDRVVQIRFLSLDRENNRLNAEVAVRVLDSNREVVNHNFKVYQQALANQGSAAEFAEALSDLLGQISQDIYQYQ